MKLPGGTLSGVPVYGYFLNEPLGVTTTRLLMADITKILVPIALTLVMTLSRLISAGDRRFQDILSIPNSNKKLNPGVQSSAMWK